MSFCLLTGTGSDVKVPRKPDRLKSSVSINNSVRHDHKRSLGKPRESGPENRNSSSKEIPALEDSQGKSDGLMDGRSTNQNPQNIEMSNSATMLPVRDDNYDSVEKAKKSPGSASCLQPRDKYKGKHSEKRKHRDSTDTDKHKSKKSKHCRDARFEGHRISHLVKKRTYKKEENEENSTADHRSDDYVLAKLFRKSGRPNTHALHLSLLKFLFLIAYSSSLVFHRYPQCDAT